MRSALYTRGFGMLTLAALLFTGCDDMGGDTGIVFADRSQEPAFVEVAPDFQGVVEVFTLMSSTDALPQTPGYTLAGSVDGAGLLRNGNGTYTYVVNNEDNYAISRLTLDETFAPVAGEYLLDSDAGIWRLCSGTLVNPREHGFGPVFLSAGESGEESQIHAVDPFGDMNESVLVDAFGRHSTENAVPLPKTAYPGKTVVFIGEDESGTYGGQLHLYLADGRGNLTDGKLYALARRNSNVNEMDMVTGESYNVEFREIPNQQALTGAELSQYSGEQLSAIAFGRIEDLDYGFQREGRVLYFNATGTDRGDGRFTKYGRTYRLTLNDDDPTKGRLEVILDGDAEGGPVGRNATVSPFQNPDNIEVTPGFVYVQEDPNKYGDETHEARIYQYDIRTGAVKVVLEIDPDLQFDPEYNTTGDFRSGVWEYGALVDALPITGEDLFILNVQAHTWEKEEFAGVDGGTRRPNENEGSQILYLRGLPRY